MQYEPTPQVRALMAEMSALETRLESLRLQSKIGMWASLIGSACVTGFVLD